MKRCIIAFATTIIAGIIGMLIDQNIGLDGNFSVVLAVATMGSFIMYSIKNTKDK